MTEEDENRNYFIEFMENINEKESQLAKDAARYRWLRDVGEDYFIAHVRLRAQRDRNFCDLNFEIDEKIKECLFYGRRT
jgi:hypothetical protein